MEIKVCFLTQESLTEELKSLYYVNEMLKDLKYIRYSRIECYKDAIVGVIRVPGQLLVDKEDIMFGCYVYQDGIFFFEEGSRLRELWEARQERFEAAASPSMVFLTMIEELARDDVLYLQEIEKQMEHMEEQLLNGKEICFAECFLRNRRMLSDLHFYYEQMISIGETMRSELGGKENEELRREWQQFAVAMERLHDYVCYLRDYALQLRDLFHSRREARQNKVFNLLTVVTTLFLPLTLLTGWYGMNFSNMPEVTWEHGYFMVITVAVVIIVVEFAFIKWKKIW